MQFTIKNHQIISQSKNNSSSKSKVSDSSTKQIKIVKNQVYLSKNQQLKSFSNGSSGLIPENKTFSLKIKQLESLATNTTDQANLNSEQQKFLSSYRNDLLFRKKIDILIKKYDKKFQEKGQELFTKSKININEDKTLRAQKINNDILLIQLYKKYKNWLGKIDKSIQTKH